MVIKEKKGKDKAEVSHLISVNKPVNRITQLLIKKGF